MGSLMMGKPSGCGNDGGGGVLLGIIKVIMLMALMLSLNNFFTQI